MSLLFQVYPLIRPALFSLDPEAAHRVTMTSLQRVHDLGLSRLFGDPPNHPRVLMGLPVRNPVGLAAGLDKNGDHIDALGALGFGFMEIGTVTPKGQAGNPQPRLFRLPEAHALINRLGFNNDGLDTFLSNVRRSTYRAGGGLLGLNIGKNASTPIELAVDDYLIGLAGVYEHADYVSVNISSPNTQNLRALQGADELSSLLRRIHESREQLADRHGKRVPLVVKIAPDLDAGQIDAIADLLPRYGIDGVVATNTTLERKAVEGLTHGNQAGGLSGAPVRELSLRVIERLRAQAGKGLTIIGVGGILQGYDAAEKIAAGADAVQLYTGLIYRGPALIKESADAIQRRTGR